MKYSLPMLVPVALERVRQKLFRLYCRALSSVRAWLWGIRHGRNLIFQGRAIIRTRKAGEINIGNNVIFNSQQTSNLVGLLGPTILDTRGGGKIEIDDNSGFSSVVISSRTLVRIGKNVKIGGNVRIFDHDFHSLEADFRRTSDDQNHIRSRPVAIGDDCFIGTNAIILKGTRIGARSIVGAGSVVFGLDVPEDSIVKGNPAVIWVKKNEE